MASIISFIVIHKVFVLLQRWRIILMKFFGLFCARAALCAIKNEVGTFFSFLCDFSIESFTLVFVFIETVHFTRCLLNVILTIVLYEFQFQIYRAVVGPGDSLQHFKLGGIYFLTVRGLHYFSKKELSRT